MSEYVCVCVCGHVVDDKTFGLTNKNQSKMVQKFVAATHNTTHFATHTFSEYVGVCAGRL